MTRTVELAVILHGSVIYGWMAFGTWPGSGLSEFVAILVVCYATARAVKALCG